MEKRVAVTGLGVLSCIGNDVQTFWKNLVDGVCGIDYITEFPTDNLAVKIGGMVRNFNPEDYGMDKPFIRKQDNFTLYAMAAAWQAMKQSGLEADIGGHVDGHRTRGGFTDCEKVDELGIAHPLVAEDFLPYER